MKNYFLPESTKYLTNNGLKMISELTEDDMIFVIDKFGNISYTKDFEIQTCSFNSLILNSDTKFQGLLASRNVDYVDLYPCIKSKEAPMVKVSLNDLVYDKELSKDFVIATALFISNFFNKVDDTLISLPQYKKKSFGVLSTINSLTGLYFGYDRLINEYSFSSSSFYKDFETLNAILLGNLEILEDIVKSLKKIKYSYYKGMYNIDFRNYKLAELFSTLISLLGYKSRVLFDKDNKTFKVTYTNCQRIIDYDWKTGVSTVNYDKPVICYSLLFKNNYKIVVSQNNNHLTTTSIINSSYNLLEETL